MPSASAARLRGTPGRVASVVACLDGGSRPGPRRVDRVDAVVPRGRGFEVKVGEARRRRVRVATDDAPGAASVVGGLDPVAEDRSAAGVAGRAPRQVDPRGADRPGCQVDRRGGHIGVRGRAHLERPLAGVHGVDRRHLVTIGRGRREAGVRESGRRRTRVALDRDPRAVVGASRPDRVAGDRRPAVAGRRLPGDGDAARSGRPRAQGLYLAGPRGVGGSFDRWGRKRPRPLGVDRGHAVVAGRAGGETAVQVGRGRAAGVGHDLGPTRDAVGGHFNQVAADRAPAVRGRARPGEAELVASPQTARNRPEARGCARSGDIGGCADDARPRAPAHPVDRRDAVMAGGAGIEAGVPVVGGSRIRVGLERRPAAVSGRGHLNAVAGDRGCADGRRRRPVQIDGGRPPGPGRQSRRRVRDSDLRRGAGRRSRGLPYRRS